MSWTEEETMEFIKMVSDHPILYDPTVLNFTNTLLKESIWEGFAQKLNKTTAEVKKSWRNLKDGFVRYKRKKRGTSENSEKINMRINNVLSFLDSVIDECTRSSRNTPVKEKVHKQTVPSENPFVVGVAHVIFDKPVEVCRSPKGGCQKFISDGRKHSPWQNIINPGNKSAAKLVKKKTSNIHEKKKQAKRPSRMVMSDSESEKDENEDDLRIPIPPYKIKRQCTSNKLNNNNKNCDIPKSANVEACKVIISNNETDEATCTNVAHIEVLNVVDHANIDLTVGEEDDNKVAKFETFTRHIQGVLNKLPQSLKTQAKEEIFKILTEYESKALEIDKANPPSDTSSSEKNISMETEIEVE